MHGSITTDTTTPTPHTSNAGPTTTDVSSDPSTASQLRATDGQNAGPQAQGTISSTSASTDSGTILDPLAEDAKAVSGTYLRQAVWVEQAPKPNGNYSHVVKSRGLVHVAGWMGDDPATGRIVKGGIEAQTKQAIRNIKSCLETAGSSLDKVLQRRIYILNMKQFRAVDVIWAEWMAQPYPVSTCVQVSGLAKERALVELEVVAEE